MTTVGIATGAGRGMGYECGKKLLGTVDHLLLVDRDTDAVTAAAGALGAGTNDTVVEPFVLDITDREGLGHLADRIHGIGALTAVLHAAGISPTMADWKRIFDIDLIGTALLADALRPLANSGTAMVCFASMSAVLRPADPRDAAIDAIMTDPLGPEFYDRIREAVGEDIENSGVAYSIAKRGVKQFVRDEAVRLGPAGARICSISPGVIDTPQGRQEYDQHPLMAALVDGTPLGRMGRADELAAVAAFLVSDDASFLNGVDLLVDGGAFAGFTARHTPAP